MRSDPRATIESLGSSSRVGPAGLTAALARVGRAAAVFILVAAPALSQAPVSDDWFVDAAGAAGLDFVYFNGMIGELWFVEMMGAGVGLFDYDGDGDLDLYFPQGQRLGERLDGEAVSSHPGDDSPSDRLYRNDLWIDGDRRRFVFVDVTERAGIAPGGYGMGVAAGDLDGNGAIDLYVTAFGSNRLLMNRGDGSFVDATDSSATDDRRWSVAASLFDFDADGWLDLYVGNYTPYRIATHRNCYADTGVVDYCGPAGVESDRLFHNTGDGRFEDVTRRSGIGLESGAGLGSVAADFDGDGRTDLYVANDADRNHLWINQGDGTFVDDALLLGTAVSVDGSPEASMGVVVGDLNADGVDDLFMSHLTNETNTVYLGSKGGMFDDASNDSGLGLPSWKYTGFGISLLDYDNDTDLDLFVANGAVKRITEQVAAGDPHPLHQVNQLFDNDGSGRFVDVSDRAGAVLELSEVSRGVASGDIDNDGDVDLVVANNAGPARLLSNRRGQDNRWIGARVGAVAGHWTPIGSAVSVATADGDVRRRRVATDGSFASSNDPRRIFGLGAEGNAAWLQIDWSSGAARRFVRPPVGYLLVLPPGAVIDARSGE